MDAHWHLDSDELISKVGSMRQTPGFLEQFASVKIV